MLNVHDLEDRYKRYKLKSYLPHITIFISIGIIFTIATILLNYKTTQTVEKLNKELVTKTDVQKIDLAKVNNKEQEKEINIVSTAQTAASTEKAITPTKEVNEKLTLTPSMDFVRKIQATTPIYYNSQPEKKSKKQPVQTKKIIEEKRTVVNISEIQIKKKKEPELKVEQKEPQANIEKKSSINIKRRETNDDIHHVIKRFKVNNNPALSLFVAKKYYQLGEYDKAYNYALITNEINNDIEASWIVFAKSLVKLNKKDKAIKTLKQYIQHSHSSQAKILLDEILSGKFK